MVSLSCGVKSRRIRFILQILAAVLLQGILVHSGYAAAQSKESGVSHLNGLYESNDESKDNFTPKDRSKTTGANQQRVLRLARNCRRLKVYRKRCVTRYVQRRRCRRVRTVVRRCKKVPVHRKACSVRTTRVRRCRGPLGQRHCSIITRRKRSCSVRTTYVTRCRQAHKTTRRCRNVRIPRKVCRRKATYVRRCSSRY